MTKDNYELRIGNGNDGNYFNSIIAMDENDSPFAFMDVVIANIFVPGHRARSHAYKHTMVDGEADYTIYATLSEGYRGETNMGAAYRTASLRKMEESELGEYSDHDFSTPKEHLDKYAMIRYKKIMKGNGGI